MILKGWEKMWYVMNWWRKQHPTYHYVLVRNGFVHATDMATGKTVMRLYADVEKEYEKGA